MSASLNLLPRLRLEDKALPVFSVTPERGFLPLQDPVATLPPEFDILESLLNRMPMKDSKGEPGLLAHFILGETVCKELIDLSPAVEKYKSNIPLITAIYRDYSTLASAYLLEPCHERHMKGKEYGLGRAVLPAVISLPLTRAAEIAGFRPFLEYAGSYALFNYKLEDPSEGINYSNLRLVRAFEHGLDPTSSEAGFVFVHIVMSKSSGPLVAASIDALEAVSNDDRDGFNASLHSLTETLVVMNKAMSVMPTKSRPRDYTGFRTFLFGIASQSMFPDGVIYEGVSEEPFFYRGESGANDCMIPLCDNLLQIKMPESPLTDVMNDLSTYRPFSHREFLKRVKTTAATFNVKGYALKNEDSRVFYLRAVNQLKEFRFRHWGYIREYIVKRTTHLVATGGSPISWLPKQLQVVFDLMIEVAALGDLPGCDEIMQSVYKQSKALDKDIQKYCE